MSGLPYTTIRDAIMWITAVEYPDEFGSTEVVQRIPWRLVTLFSDATPLGFGTLLTSSPQVCLHHLRGSSSVA